MSPMQYSVKQRYDRSTTPLRVQASRGLKPLARLPVTTGGHWSLLTAEIESAHGVTARWESSTSSMNKALYSR